MISNERQQLLFDQIHANKIKLISYSNQFMFCGDLFSHKISKYFNSKAFMNFHEFGEKSF